LFRRLSSLLRVGDDLGVLLLWIRLPVSTATRERA
jgi:hypothetical protein